VPEPSRDYHDYVIRDGRLIGEFEAMYRNSDAVPWHQDEQRDWMDVRLTFEMLRDLPRFGEIHDLGCGLGYYLALARERAGAPGCRAFGYDISATACDKARTLFPEFTFTTHDITVAPAPPPAGSMAVAPRLFVIRGTLWYVYPKLAEVVCHSRAMLAAGDTLLVVQNFPPLDRNFVGKDVIPDHAALVRHFSSHFALTRHAWYQDALRTANDNWFIGLFSPR
jgi:SAM-dependent methyltransferase